jgi:DNA replication protein DnaC
MSLKHDKLPQDLRYLNLNYITQHYDQMAQEAAKEHLGHVDYLSRLIAGEAAARYERSVHRRVMCARLPVIKTLDQFNWGWPTKINRTQVQDIFRLRFIEQKANVVFVGGVGLGKTHLAVALAHTACMHDVPVLFAPAVQIINTLSAAQSANALTKTLKQYLRPRLLIIDELGYLPMDKRGADLLFQVISARYEYGSIVLTTNTAYKQWPKVFNNDATLASAVLDRLIHHCETVAIEGKSYRMKDKQ